MEEFHVGALRSSIFDLIHPHEPVGHHRRAHEVEKIIWQHGVIVCRLQVFISSPLGDPRAQEGRDGQPDTRGDIFHLGHGDEGCEGLFLPRAVHLQEANAVDALLRQQGERGAEVPRRRSGAFYPQAAPVRMIDILSHTPLAPQFAIAKSGTAGALGRRHFRPSARALDRKLRQNRRASTRKSRRPVSLEDTQRRQHAVLCGGPLSNALAWLSRMRSTHHLPASLTAHHFRDADRD